MQTIDKYIVKEVNGEEYAMPNPLWQKHVQELKFDYFLKSSGIPDTYWNLNFEDVGFGMNERPTAVCSQYVDKLKYGAKRNLMIYGNGFTGRTTILSNIGKRALKEGLKVKYIKSGNLLKIIQDSVDFNSSIKEEGLEKYNSLFKSDLLLIDDLFDPERNLMWKSESKSIIVQAWYNFLSEFLNKGNICFTTNIIKERIANDYSNSLYNLIDGNFKVLEFKESVMEKRKKTLGLLT